MNLWKSRFFECAMLEVMKKELSQKERNETVNKGYFHDTLEEVLDSKDYVTKDWAQDMFEVYRKENREYFEALMEQNRNNLQAIVEVFDSKIERIHRHVGLAPL